jgi:ABC-type sugar transport system substrate-binding protein
MRIPSNLWRGSRGLPAIAAVAIVSLSLGLAACGGDDDDDGGGGGGDSQTVYLNAYAQEIPYFRDWHDGATARAEELGWEVTSEYGNTTPEQQVQQLENALVTQPDGILVTAIDEESLIPVLTRAREQGVKVVTVGGDAASDEARDVFVARDNYKLGVDKAQYVIDQLGGQGTVGIVHGIRGLTFTEDQADGYDDTLSKASGIEVVDGPYTGGFSADLGLNATQNLLTANPDLEAIIYDNDDLAQGGAEAVQNRGISLDDFLILGTDGSAPALDLVERGVIDMTISLCGYREGASAIDVLNDLVEDQEVPKRVVSRVETFTTENVKEKRASLTREECN